MKIKALALTALMTVTNPGFSQDLNGQLADRINGHRHRLGIDSLVFDRGQSIHEANEEYCEGSVYADSVEQSFLDSAFDTDTRVAPYCIALNMCLEFAYEFEFRSDKGLNEFDFDSDELGKRDFDRIFRGFMDQNEFLNTVSVGMPGGNGVTRRVSVASARAVRKFRSEPGRHKDRYWLEVVWLVNVILYLK